MESPYFTSLKARDILDRQPLNRGGVRNSPRQHGSRNVRQQLHCNIGDKLQSYAEGRARYAIVEQRSRRT